MIDVHKANKLGVTGNAVAEPEKKVQQQHSLKFWGTVKGVVGFEAKGTHGIVACVTIMAMLLLTLASLI